MCIPMINSLECVFTEDNLIVLNRGITLLDGYCASAEMMY